MKKPLIAALAVLCLAMLAACGKKEAETTAPQTSAAPQETERYEGPTLDEMSPPSLSTAMPIEVARSWQAVNKSDFRPVRLADSRWPDSGATTVYRSGDTEYYIMEGGVGYALIGNEEDGSFYSAYYGKDGSLSYFGDEQYNWFFNEAGEFDYMTYTYTAVTGAEVVSFYEGENTRFAVYAGQTYYDGDLNELTEEQKVKLVMRVAAAFSMMGGMDAM